MCCDRQGLYLYDRFFLELIIVSKIKTFKSYASIVMEKNKGETHWLVKHYLDLVHLLSNKALRYFLSRNILLHIGFQFATLFQLFSQARLISFDELLSFSQDSPFLFFIPSNKLPKPTSYEEAVFLMITAYKILYQSSPAKVSEEICTEPKYDETNIIDLKLREFLVLDFTSVKVQLYDYYRELVENKFPKLLVIAGQTSKLCKGVMEFFDSLFPSNHNIDFTASLAFLLASRGEYVRCENIVKQLLEKPSFSSPNKM